MPLQLSGNSGEGKRRKTMSEQDQNVGFTSGQIKQLEFWRGFSKFSSGKMRGLKFLKPYPHYYDIDFGFPKVLISCKMNTFKKLLHCEIDIPDSEKTYQRFLLDKELIRNEFGEELQWIDKPKKVRRVRVSREFYLEERSEWENYFGWLLGKAEKFQKVFSKFK